MTAGIGPLALIRIRGLRYRYPNSTSDVLRIPSLDISGRGLIALTGPSGAGKSTLVELLAGTLHEPYEGSVQVLGAEWHDLTRDADRQRQLRRIGLIPQDFGLVPSWTVGQTVRQALIDADVPRQQHDERISEALRVVGLTDFWDREAGSLSGGQRQRVAIARVLARDVELVIADEPTANLDPPRVQSLLRLLHEIARHVPVVVVTHDSGVAEACDRTIILQSAAPTQPVRAPLAAGGSGTNWSIPVAGVAAVALAAAIGFGLARPHSTPSEAVPPLQTAALQAPAVATGATLSAAVTSTRPAAQPPRSQVAPSAAAPNSPTTIAPPQSIYSLAGTTAGYADGPGTAARFEHPAGVAADRAGYIYVTDYTNNRIRRISPSGTVETWAGSGLKGVRDGRGMDAAFSAPWGEAIDPSGNLYISDGDGNTIRQVSRDRSVTTIVGSGAGGFADGPARSAAFNHPSGLALDASGNLYVADYTNNRVRKIAPNGMVSTLAGNGAAGFTDGSGRSALFNHPSGLAVDRNGYVYVTDAGNQRIRLVSPAGMVTTLAGTGIRGAADGPDELAQFDDPSGIILDATGNLYVTDAGSSRIRFLSGDGQVSTVTGFGGGGFADGPLTTAQLSAPQGITVDTQGRVEVADFGNHRIRVIMPIVRVTR